ncbi:MAG: hypothetical protein AB9903_31945 [Vulcanimicrobiota bacterium]
MTQCVNTDELTRNDTLPYTDSMDLVQGTDSFFFLKKGVCPHPAFSSEEVHKRALAARKLYGKAEKALTFCTNAKISTIPKWCLFCALVMLH